MVVLEPGAELAEGTSVRVETEAASAKESSPAPLSPEDAPLFDMSKFAVDTGISDLAVNLDHYLYGHPKVTDAE
ncbi:MAG: hypothetical protein HY674_21600 [Chloroflexi bacterium]|nr:hypothetical protein [Chloroflexota bacterium]